MLRLNSILVFSENPKELAGFYSQVLEKEPEWEEEDYSGFAAGDTAIMVGPHKDVKGKNKNPERIMFNLETDDVEGEFERIKELGAKVIAEPYTPGETGSGLIATFADPDGNYFQLTTPMAVVVEETEEETDIEID